MDSRHSTKINLTLPLRQNFGLAEIMKIFSIFTVRVDPVLLADYYEPNSFISCTGDNQLF